MARSVSRWAGSRASVEVNARAQRVGELAVVACPVKRGVEVEAVADVGDDDERRRRVDGRGIAESLPERLLHRDVPGRSAAPGGADLLGVRVGALFRLQNEAAAFVQIDEADGVPIAAVEQDGLALEHVLIALRIARLRVRMRNSEHVAEIEQEGVFVRPLRGGGILPFGREGG
jgi:hypothetical protein